MRFSYSEDEDFNGQFSLWQANCRRSMKGKKGQAAFRDMRDALLAMPEKRLVSGVLYDDKGGVCAIGALLRHKGVDLQVLDPEDATDETGARLAKIPPLVAWKIVERNDVWCDIVTGEYSRMTAEERYTAMLAWVEAQLTPSA